jgi:hypothetical protein
MLHTKFGAGAVGAGSRYYGSSSTQMHMFVTQNFCTKSGRGRFCKVTLCRFKYSGKTLQIYSGSATLILPKPAWIVGKIRKNL